MPPAMSKICIIGSSKKYFGGLSAYTICLANALAESATVSVLMLRNLLPRFMYPGKQNVGRQDFNIGFKPGIRTYEGMDWNSPVTWIKAYRFLKTEKPDVMLMQWWTSSVIHMELFIAVINRMKIRVPIILEMHEVIDPAEAGRPLLRLYSKTLGKMIMNRAGAFVTHSVAAKEEIIRTYGINADSVFVIPHGPYDVYGQEYTRESAKNALGISEKFVILCLGMIRKYKGIPNLIQAFNRLPEAVAANCRLIIAGEDWGDEKGLAEMINLSPYNRQILYKPEFVPDSDIPKYFAAADVVVLPYLRTSGSGVTSLAAAYGKSIIISDLEHTRESLKNYDGAMFVPVGDPSSIALRITALYARQQSGEAANYHVPPEKSWQYITKEYEKVIQNL